MAAKRTSDKAFAASVDPMKKQKTNELNPGVKIPQSAISLYLEEAEFTDAVLVCKGRVWHVHRLRLADCSGYFKKAFSTKHRTFEEGVNNMIDFGESEDPESIERLLTWIYTPELVPSKDTSPGEGLKEETVLDEAIGWKLDLMRLADYFMIPDLFEKSSTDIAQMVRFSNFSSKDPPATSALGLPLSTFCAVGRHMLEYSHEAIRAQWVATATFNWSELHDVKEFQDFICEAPELIIEMLDLLHSTASWQERFQKSYERSSLYKKCAKPVIQTAKKKMKIEIGA